MESTESKPWVSFCMSTFNRPDFLRVQVASLLEQSFTNFEIVIADNDPKAGGRAIIETFADPRIHYECNGKNIGMVPSFNQSIDRARGKYIVMVTDDDPVAIDFLSVFYSIIQKYPGYSLYGGLKRSYTKEGELEVIEKDKFISEFLDLDKTVDILWSSCLFKREVLIQIGKLPDYDGPHLVDHALLAIAGSINGALLVNKMYSNIVLHQTNFSKSNFFYYYNSCLGFYNLMTGFIRGRPLFIENKKVIVEHLGKWFISSIFNLLNYYNSGKSYDRKKIEEVKQVAEKILKLPFMKRNIFKYRVKMMVLLIKFRLGIKK